MKTRVLILLSALLFMLSPQCLYANDDPLIGEWVSATRTKGSLGGSKYFNKDGTVIVTFGALVDFTYKTKDNILSLYDDKGTFIADNEFKFSGSNLILKNTKGGEAQELTRVQGEPLPNIIGKWVGDHYTGKKQCIHFTKGLNCYFSVPFEQVKGTYKVNGDTYTEEFSEKEKTEWKISIENDLLTLTKKDGSKVEKYRKKK